jgi:RNA polymerase sigma factor (sigma-70 family)
LGYDINMLLSTISRGDLKALEELYSLLRGSIYAFSLSILKDKSTAEDVLQETFIKLWDARENHKPDKNGRAWVFTIARNLCLDKLRAQGKTLPLSSEQDDDCVPMYIELNSNIELRDALSTLNESTCRIVLLHLTAGFKFREIATLLSIEQSSAEWQYYSGIKKLSAYFRVDSQPLKGEI